ncbi:hypothetical protein T484DRAFT_1767101, partial [Baffinella frigidus]
GDVEALREKVREVEETGAWNAGRVEALEAELVEMEEGAEAMMEENRILREEQGDAEERGSLHLVEQVSALERTVDELKEELEHVEHTANNGLSMLMEEAAERAKAIEAEMVALEEGAEALMLENRLLREQQGEGDERGPLHLAEQVSALERTVDELKEELAHVESTANVGLSMLMEEGETLLTEATARIAALEAELAGPRAEHEKLAAGAGEKGAEENGAEEKGRIAALEVKVAAARGEAEAGAGKVKTLEAEMVALRGEMEQMAAWALEEALQARVLDDAGGARAEEAAGEVARAREVGAALEASLAEMSASLETARGEVAGHAGEMAARQQLLEGEAAGAEEARVVASRLESELAAVSGELSASQAALEDARAELEGVRQRSRVLEAEGDTARSAAGEVSWEGPSVYAVLARVCGCDSRCGNRGFRGTIARCRG